MHKAPIAQLIIAAVLSASLTATANTSENFNSRKGVPLQQVRAQLQNNCWTFHHFDVNQKGWNPKIEGDGAMVSGDDALLNNNAGIFTPLLNINSNITISFDYLFDKDFSSSEKRWVKLCLANSNNVILQVLEQFKINGIHASRIKNYSTEFTNITPGQYRLVLLYGGSGGTSKIAIDELMTSAPFAFDGGCSAAPTATKNKITGMPDRTASGSAPGVTTDHKTFLVKPSADGTVNLNTDGTFVFVPNSQFRGHQTSFEYRICENGTSNLCSAPSVLNINFPAHISNQLVDFKGSYLMDGNVELYWNTIASNNTGSFEIERSLDGKSWQRSGIIPAKKIVTNPNDYTYIDKVNKNTALKKDLYYRLKLIHTDGQISTSRLMVVRVYNTKTLTMISVTPSPSKKDIAVNVQLHGSSYVSMRVMDQNGTQVLHKIVEAGEGDNNILIPGSSELIPGSYNLEVIVNSKERMLVSLIKE